jgi:hypothetical protein
MAGAVRFCGNSLLEHRQIIISTLEFAFASEDKHTFKSGCKLLRHVLYSQCECYPVASTYFPHSKLGKSYTLSDSDIHWHYPNGNQLDFCVEILEKFMLSILQDTVSTTKVLVYSEAKISDDRSLLKKWRRVLKIVRYVARGMTNLLADREGHNEKIATLHEKAISFILSQASEYLLELMYYYTPSV